MLICKKHADGFNYCFTAESFYPTKNLNSVSIFLPFQKYFILSTFLIYILFTYNIPHCCLRLFSPRFISMKFKAVTFIDSSFLNCFFEDVSSVGSFFKNCTFVDSFFYNTGKWLWFAHTALRCFLPPEKILLCCGCRAHKSHSVALWQFILGWTPALLGEKERV